MTFEERTRREAIRDEILRGKEKRAKDEDSARESGNGSEGSHE